MIDSSHGVITHIQTVHSDQSRLANQAAQTAQNHETEKRLYLAKWQLLTVFAKKVRACTSEQSIENIIASLPNMATNIQSEAWDILLTNANLSDQQMSRSIPSELFRNHCVQVAIHPNCGNLSAARLLDNHDKTRARGVFLPISLSPKISNVLRQVAHERVGDAAKTDSEYMAITEVKNAYGLQTLKELIRMHSQFDIGEAILERLEPQKGSGVFDISGNRDEILVFAIGKIKQPALLIRAACEIDPSHAETLAGQRPSDDVDYARMTYAQLLSLPTLPYAFFQFAMDSNDPVVQLLAASHDSAPSDILGHMARQLQHPACRAAIAANPATSADTLDYLSRDADATVRLLVAGRDETAAETLEKMLEDARNDILIIAKLNETIARKRIEKIDFSKGKIDVPKPAAVAIGLKTKTGGCAHEGCSVTPIKGRKYCHLHPPKRR